MQRDESESGIKVSVVVPAFQACNTIAACLQALAEQDFAYPYEIIVVDDGSNDNTAEIASAFCDHVIEHEEKNGAAAARNSGIYAARGEIVCFTDADCAPAKTWMSQMLIPFDDPEIIGAKGAYKSKQKDIVARFVQIEYEDKYDLLRRQERIDFIDTYSAAYRHDVLLSNGGFDESTTSDRGRCR